MSINIYSHTSDSYAHAILALLGKGARQAKLLYKEWFRFGTRDGRDKAFNNCRSLLQEMIALTDFSLPPLLRTLDEEKTGKILIGTDDGYEIESVLLPMKAGHTLCLSSQIGCKMGCAFCETAKMGLVRSLSAREIVCQFFHARHTLKCSVRNLVFMGMGEPLDNFDNLVQALAILTDPHGCNIGAGHITVSTSGLLRPLALLAQKMPAIKIAISVNAPDDATRNRLMPVNRTHAMAELKEAMIQYCQSTGKRLFIEYVLIEGKNDSLEAAEKLAHYLQGLTCTVNLIPYNPGRRGIFTAPPKETVDLFATYLKKEGLFATVRSTKGQRIMAACGQLGNRKKNTA
jgi:23S rRNA (adenine2503-C2)-methyltransferase